MFNMEKFANLLTAKRRDKNLTQSQLSQLVGVTHQAVSKWERAETMPEISKIGDLAKALDTPAEEFMSCLYGSETQPQTTTEGAADEAYFALEDKTSVGDLYTLAPKMSKSVLELAIDNLISAKGAAAASMLFRFADREYLSSLGTVLFKQGDTRLAEYVNEDSIKSAIVDMVSKDPDMSIYLDKIGQLLTYCKDADFVYDIFDYMLARHTYWNSWHNYISKFPSETVVKQGIKMAVNRGPNCFYNWWDVVGRRNIAKIFIGYIENYEKNNFRAWQDISNHYHYADSSIMEKYIKERLAEAETDPQIFKPIVNRVSSELQEMLAAKNVIPNQPQNNGNFAFGGNQRSNTSVNNVIKDLIIAKIADEISEIDVEDLPDYLGRLKKSLKKAGIEFNLDGGDEGINGNVNAWAAELEDHLDDLDSRIDELESRIEELESLSGDSE